MKTCTKCGVSKDEAQFSPDRRRKLNGLQSCCKQCTNEYQKKRYRDPKFAEAIQRNAKIKTAVTLERYYQRRDEGLCGMCSRNAIPGKTRCARCAKLAIEQGRKRREKRNSAGFCGDCGSPSRTGIKMCVECAKRKSSLRRDNYRKLKEEAFDAYGGKSCACCGESMERFLTFDHINNDGNVHRREVGQTGKLIEWLKARNFPPGIQILCYNCNMGKARNGGVCPHQQVTT